MGTLRSTVAMFVLATALSAAPVTAQTLTLTWQMQPFCNRIAVTLTPTTTGFMLHGFDDLCGAGARASVVGTAVLNPNGTAGVNFVVIPAPGAPGVQVAGVVSPATAQGTWSDSFGNGGTFVANGATPGLPVRPHAPRILEVAASARPPSNPCAVLPVPVMQYCGSATSYWQDGGYGVPGLQIWVDAERRVHLRGSLSRVSGGGGPVAFNLPAELSPPRFMTFQVATSLQAGVHQSGTALLFLSPSAGGGAPTPVFLSNDSTAGHSVFHLGEIIYSLDR